MAYARTRVHMLDSIALYTHALTRDHWRHGEVFGFDEGDTFSDNDSFTEGV